MNIKKIAIITILCSLFLCGCTPQEAIEIESLTSPKPSIKNTEKKTTPTKNKYVCDCSKTCSQMIDCDEAYFQLNDCGCTKRDRDNDGIPCESICL